MKDKIYLGKVKPEVESTQSYNQDKHDLYILGENIYLEKHSFDCGWYWGFGYIGNRRLHTHASIFINELLWHNKNEVFKESIFKTDDDFWIFKDLLKQAYTLQKCAEIYQYGGHCITHSKTVIIKNNSKADIINKDLETVLDQLWTFLSQIRKGKKWKVIEQ